MANAAPFGDAGSQGKTYASDAGRTAAARRRIRLRSAHNSASSMQGCKRGRAPPRGPACGMRWEGDVSRHLTVVSQTSTRPGRPMGAPEQDERKERVLHTRVPQSLDRQLKQ